MATNDLKGRVDLNVAGALDALKSAQKAFRDLEKASTDAGAKMTASQRAATKAIIDEYAKLRTAQSKVVDNAIAMERKLREIERKGVNDRANARKVTDAKVAGITIGTNDKSVESASRVNLINQKAITEEKRQQIMLADAEARRTSLALRDQLALRKQIFRETRATAQAHDEALTSLNGMRYVLADVGRSMLLLSAGAAILPLATATVAIQWEKDFANVIRTSQVAESEIGNLKAQFVSLVTTMPVNWEELTKIGTLAGQLGIAKEQIGSFTKTVAMFSATTDVSAEDAATAFGRLNSLLPDVNGNFTKLGDAIAKVGVESVATESSIIRITTQIAAVAGLAGFTSQEVIGLAGALASVGVPPELSRGVITRVFADITKASSEGGIELEKWGKFVGMSGDEFRKAWGSDASGTFLKFMDSIKDKGNSAQLAIRDLGITSVRDVPILLRLANAMSSTGEAGGLLAESFDNAKNSAGEMQRQYDIISGTTAAKLQVFVQTFQSLIDAVGSSALGNFGDILDGWAEGFRDLARSLDEPVRLLGSIKLPFTGGEAIGGAIGGAAAVAGIALIISAITRLVQGVIASRIAFHTFRTDMAANSAAAIGNAGAMNTAALATGQFATKTSLASRAAGGFKSALSTITSAGFAAALIGISLAVDAINKSLENVGSNGQEVANSILTAKDALEAISEIEIGGRVGGAGGSPWAAATTDVKNLAAGLKLLDESANSNGFMIHSSEQNNIMGDTSKLLEKLNDGYQELINAGNEDAVFGSVRGLATQLNLTDDALSRLIYNTPTLNKLFKETFNAQGIDITERNLLKLARGGLAAFGIEAKQSTEEAAAFDAAMQEVEQQAQASLDALSAAAAGFFDFSSAIDSATEDGVLNLATFMDTIRAQAEAQVTWQQNLLTLSAQGASSGFLSYLTSLGPQAASLIQEFTANPTALAEAQALWEQHGTDSATKWASAFQAQQELADAVGLAFGKGARDAFTAELDADNADIPGIMAKYNRLLLAHKLFPQLDMSSAQAAMDTWIAVQNSRVVTIKVNATNPNIGFGLGDGHFNGGYIGGYDGGGYTGDGGKFDPAGVVHKGEFVFTKKATAAIGVPQLYAIMRAAQSRGYSGGGIANTSSSYVPSFGTSGSFGGGGGFSTLDAASIQALTSAFIEAMQNSSINLYTTDTLLATSNNRGSTALARQGKN